MTMAGFNATTRGDVHHTTSLLSIDRVEQRGTEGEGLTELFRSYLSLLVTMGSRSLFEAHNFSYSFMPCLKCPDTDRELKLDEITAGSRVNVSRTLHKTFQGFIGNFCSNFDGWDGRVRCRPVQGGGVAQQFVDRVHATPEIVSDCRLPDGCHCASDPRHHLG